MILIAEINIVGGMIMVAFVVLILLGVAVWANRPHLCPKCRAESRPGNIPSPYACDKCHQGFKSRLDLTVCKACSQPDNLCPICANPVSR